MAATQDAAPAAALGEMLGIEDRVEVVQQGVTICWTSPYATRFASEYISRKDNAWIF